MIKKIILLTVTPFNKRDFKRFGIELLMKNGFEVEVWNLTNILFPHYTRNYTLPDPINWSGHKIYDNKKYVLNKLEELSSDAFIIPFFLNNLKCYSIYKAISASDAKYASFMANALPSVKNNHKLKVPLNIFKKIRKGLWKKIVNYSSPKLPFRWLGIKPVRLILAGGSKSLKYPELIASSAEILWIHTLDYDLYLEERNKRFAEQPIVVFIDEYLPFHPSYSYGLVKPNISANKYYLLLNKFFKLIEDQLGLEVIIAAHPRSNYENHPDYFEYRKWIRGQTIKLVKESKLVLAHSSTALNFANLYYKPVIFLTSSELDKSYQGPFIREFANLFGKKPIYIDKDINIDWNFEFKVSKIHYENYLRNYIKTDHSEELSFWQIVANKLKKGF